MAWPAPFPGWLLEPVGDAWPRGMTVTPQGAQDPAYRPTPPFLLASLLAVSLRGLRARVNRSVINSTPAVHGLTFHNSRFEPKFSDPTCAGHAFQAGTAIATIWSGRAGDNPPSRATGRN